MQCIQNYYMHLYKSPGILLKENNKLKNATDVFLHETHNNVSSFCQGASIVILNISLTGDTHKIFVSRPSTSLTRRASWYMVGCKPINDSPFKFNRNLVHNQASYKHISYVSNWMCLWRRYNI